MYAINLMDDDNNRKKKHEIIVYEKKMYKKNRTKNSFRANANSCPQYLFDC